MCRLIYRLREQARSHIGIHSQSIYAQSLLVSLWITCSRFTASHVNRGLQASDQKTTSLSRGFSWLFFLDNYTTCPQSLLALLWIRCSLYAASLIKHGVYGFDQKTIKYPLQTCEPLSNPRFFTSCSAFPQTRRTYPRSLLALLWIRCSPSSAGHAERAIQAVDQIVIDRTCKP